MQPRHPLLYTVGQRLGPLVEEEAFARLYRSREFPAVGSQHGPYAATATLKNNGPSAVALLVSLVLTLPLGVTLSRRMVLLAESALVNATLSGPLQPGATTQINLEFINPNGVPIVAPTKVLAGPGGR